MIINFFSIPAALLLTCYMLGMSYFSADSAVEHSFGFFGRGNLEKEIGILRINLMLFSSKRLGKYKTIFCICRAVFYIGCIQAIIWLVLLLTSHIFNIFDKSIEVFFIAATIFSTCTMMYWGILETGNAYRGEKNKFYLQQFCKKYKQQKCSWEIIKNDPAIPQKKKQKMLYKQAETMDMISSFALHDSSINQTSIWNWVYGELQRLNQYFEDFGCRKSIEKYVLFWIFPRNYVERYFCAKKQSNADAMLKSIERFLLRICDTYATCYDNDALSDGSIQSIEESITALEQIIADFKSTRQYLSNIDFIEVIQNIQEDAIEVQRCCKSKEKLPKGKIWI